MKISKKVLVVFLLPVFCSLSFLFMKNGSGNNLANQLTVPQFVSAYPDPVDVEQPDGTRLTIVMKGDEWAHYTRTIDGYTVLKDNSGFYRYAVLDNEGDMVMSTVIARNPEIRGNSETGFLQSLKSGLTYSEKQSLNSKYNRYQDENLSGVQFAGISGTFPSSGTRKFLVILINFTDKAFVKTNANFTSLYNTGSNSFKQYHLDTSYNALTVNTTVVGPYTLSGSMATYGANDEYGYDVNPRLMVQEAVDAAQAAGVDFSQYDNDGNGYVDGIQVVHAGYGEEYSGVTEDAIWSHRWTLAGYARTYDGVTINDYSTVPELYGGSGSTITGVGVVCHEFGHNLGCPDTYDTSGWGAWDLQDWDIMAGGSWNNNGNNPPIHNPYSRWKLGWTTPTQLYATTNVTLLNVAQNNVTYRFDTTTANEFFLLDNRQNLGTWDYYLPGHGLAIFHVDENWISTHLSNNINTNDSHQGIDLEEADDLRTYGSFGGDLFPGTGSKTSFTDSTTPSAKSWANANTSKPITNIVENSNIITFNIKFGTLTLTAPNGGENWAVRSTQNITWTDTGSVTNVKLQYSSDNGNNWSDIDPLVPNTGSYSWTIPTVSSSQCLVKISDAANASCADISDAVFTISNPSSITVTSPNGYENWLVGSAHSIVWANTGTISNVKIEYTTNNGTSWNVIANSAANTGSFSWTVPNIPSSDCKVRVSDASIPSTTDSSNKKFSIVTGFPAYNKFLSFNGDNLTDILWRNYSGEGANRLWITSGITLSDPDSISTQLPSTAIKRIFLGILDNDPDGNGINDELVYSRMVPEIERMMNDNSKVAEIVMSAQAQPGNSIEKQMNALLDLFESQTISVPTTQTIQPISDLDWKMEGTGDFNTDGKLDIILRNYSSGKNLIWMMNGNSLLRNEVLPYTANLNWKMIGGGDFDGDGKADILWRNYENGKNIIWIMDGLTFKYGVYIPTVADLDWEMGGVGDMNGDGKMDICWRHKTTGANKIWIMNRTTYASESTLPSVTNLAWKMTGCGEFNSDGKTDIIFRNDNGNNLVWIMNGLYFTSIEQLPAEYDSNWKIEN